MRGWSRAGVTEGQGFLTSPLSLTPPNQGDLMQRTTIREFLDSLHCGAELPLVPVGACLEEVVRVMVKGHRRRIVYVVDGDRQLKGAITLSHLKDIIFRFFLDERLGNALVVSERIALYLSISSSSGSTSLARGWFTAR